VHVTARSDYALRAVAELAAAEDRLLKRDEISARQGIPVEFLESVLLALKHRGIVRSQRGASGGFRLARPPTTIRRADDSRAGDGPMANVRGERPELVEYPGPASRLQDVWVAVRASLPEILVGISVDDLVNGRLPDDVQRLTSAPEAWISLGRSRRTADATAQSARRPARSRAGAGK
jgi:Rrf2 family protein